MNTILTTLAKKLLLVEPRAKAREKRFDQQLSALRRTTSLDKKVALLVPVYNVAPFLPKCLDSLLTQTYPNLEIICVNDASSDGSLAILQKYANNNDKITVVDKSQNAGLPQARKTALSAVSPDTAYILNIDSDDWAEPDMVETLYLLAESGYDMTYCDYLRGADGNETPVHIPTIPENDKRLRIEQCFYIFYNTIWNRLIARNLYEKVVFPTANMGEDVAINAQLYYYADRIGYAPKALYHHTYLSNPHSISANNAEQNLQDIRANYDHVYHFAKDKLGTDPIIEKNYRKKCIQIKHAQENYEKSKKH